MGPVGVQWSRSASTQAGNGWSRISDAISAQVTTRDARKNVQEPIYIMRSSSPLTCRRDRRTCATCSCVFANPLVRALFAKYAMGPAESVERTRIHGLSQQRFGPCAEGSDSFANE